jgi:hypothetical protein
MEELEYSESTILENFDIPLTLADLPEAETQFLSDSVQDDKRKI